MKSTHKKNKTKKEESVLLVWRLHTEFGLKSRFFWQLLLDYKIVFGWKKKTFNSEYFVVGLHKA